MGEAESFNYIAVWILKGPGLCSTRMKSRRPRASNRPGQKGAKQGEANLKFLNRNAYFAEFELSLIAFRKS